MTAPMHATYLGGYPTQSSAPQPIATSYAAPVYYVDMPSNNDIRPDLYRRQSIASIRHLIDELDGGRAGAAQQMYVMEKQAERPLDGRVGLGLGLSAIPYDESPLARRTSDTDTETASTVSSRDFVPSDMSLGTTPSTTHFQAYTGFPFFQRPSLSSTGSSSSIPHNSYSRAPSMTIIPQLPPPNRTPLYSASIQPTGSSRAPISRTTKACNACRGRKVRCDAGGAGHAGEELPCSRCVDSGVNCEYSMLQRKRGPAPGSTRGSGAGKRKVSSAVVAQAPPYQAVPEMQVYGGDMGYMQQSRGLVAPQMDARSHSQPEFNSRQQQLFANKPYARVTSRTPSWSGAQPMAMQHAQSHQGYYGQLQQPHQQYSQPIYPSSNNYEAAQYHLQPPMLANNYNGMSRSPSSSSAMSYAPAMYGNISRSTSQTHFAGEPLQRARTASSFGNGRLDTSLSAFSLSTNAQPINNLSLPPLRMLDRAMEVQV